jgi:hypothetical protein
VETLAARLLAAEEFKASAKDWADALLDVCTGCALRLLDFFCLVMEFTITTSVK